MMAPHVWKQQHTSMQHVPAQYSAATACMLFVHRQDANR